MKANSKKRMKKKITPWIIYGTLFSLGACGTAYMLPASGTETIIVPSSTEDDNGETLTDEAKFVNRFLNQATGTGLSAQLNLEVAFPDKDGDDSTNNVIKLSTEDLYVYLKSDENSKMTFNFALNAMVDYNGYGLALGINYTDTSLYFSLGNKMQKADGSLPSDPHTEGMTPAGAIDLKYRVTDVDDVDELAQTVADIIASVERDFGSLDLITRLLGKSEGPKENEQPVEGPTESQENESGEEESSGLDYSIVKTANTAGGYTFDFNLNVKDIAIHLTLNADEDYNLVSAFADDMTFGDITIRNISVYTQQVNDVPGAIRSLIPADAASYTRIVDMNNVIRDLYEIADTHKFKVSLTGSLLNKYKVAQKKEDNVSLNNEIVWPDTVDNDDSEEAEHKELESETIDFDMNAMIDIDKKAFDFDLGASYTNKDNVTSTKRLAADYLPADDYDKAEGKVAGNVLVSFNEYKFGMDHKGINELVGTFKDELEESLTDNKEEKKDSENVLSKLEDMISFLGSDAVKAIKNGQYYKLADCITSLTSKADEIKAVLSLKDFDLGDDAKVELLIKHDDTKKPVAINVTDLEFGDDKLDLNLAVEGYPDDFHSPTVEEIAQYQFIEGVPNIARQVKGLVKDPKMALDISASVLDSENSDKGLLVSGSTAFDANKDAKFGTGHLQLVQLGTKIKKNVDKVHDIKIDVDQDYAYVHYDTNQSNSRISDNEGLNAKVSMTSIDSIIDQVMDLLTSGQDRFTKFFSGASKSASNGILSDLMSGKFSPLLENKILLDMQLNESSLETSSRKAATSSVFTLSGKALGFDKDEDGNYSNLTLRIGYDGNGEIASIKLNGLKAGGKSIDAEIALQPYTTAKSAPQLSHSMKYMDMSSLDVLVSDLITTAKQSDFHIYDGTIGVKLLGLDALTVHMSADIHVQGNKTYAMVKASLNLIGSLVLRVNGAGENHDKNGNRVMTLYYAPGTWNDVNNPGHLYLHTEDTYKKGGFLGIGAKEVTDVNDKCYDENYLKESDNLITFLMGDLLNCTDTIVDKVKDAITNGKDSDSIAFEDIFTSLDKGFVYEELANGGHSWDLGINLGILNSALGDLDVTITSGSSGIFNAINASTSIIAIVEANIEAYLRPQRISDADKANYNSYIHNYNGPVIA